MMEEALGPHTPKTTAVDSHHFLDQVSYRKHLNKRNNFPESREASEEYV